MMLPVILCRLCDKNGEILNAYDPNSIQIHELTTSEARPVCHIRCDSRLLKANALDLSISGHVAISTDGRNLSSPIPFDITQKIEIFAPKHAELHCVLNNFTCTAAWLCNGNIKIKIKIDTLVQSIDTDAHFSCSQYAEECGGETIDSVRMLSRICLEYKIMHLRAYVDEFNALSDGQKRVYTNRDDLKGYGGRGIPSPREVSYYNLYVNGVLQPKVNYIIREGFLEFVTADLPKKGETVLLRFITFKQYCAVHVLDYQYFTISDGEKRIYTDSDELKKYSCHGIPGPDKVSYYNLFVNGVLQPTCNYEVEKGMLKLKTSDVPQRGQSVILESVAIRNPEGKLYKVELYQFDTLSRSQRVYCPKEELSYGDGILEPCQSSYQNLFVNAVNQPSVNYETVDDKLILCTEDLPLKRSPLSMQSVRVMHHGDCICMCSCGDCIH